MFVFGYMYRISRLKEQSGKSTIVQQRINIILAVSIAISLSSCSIVPLERNSVISTHDFESAPEVRVINSEYYGYGFITSIGSDDSTLEYIRGTTVSQNIYILKSGQYIINVLISVLFIPAMFYIYVKREKIQLDN
jgi:hypothetical protein